MLMLTQCDGDSILIGDEQTAVVTLTPQDRHALAACSDVWLLDLAQRLLAAPRGPIQVVTVHTRGRDVRIGVDAPRTIPVHRSELRRRAPSGGRAA